MLERRIPSLGRASAVIAMAALLFTGLSADSTTAQSTERATTDRPDEVSGFQVHPIYVLPSDRDDQQLDTDGTIATSIEAFQRWFEAESGGQRVRLDTFNGQPDITFLRLGLSEAVLKDRGPQIREGIEAGLIANGFDDPRKLYAVYYGGSTTFSCGSAAWPPKTVGSAAVLYQFGQDERGGAPCESVPFAGSADDPGLREFGIIHEIFHSLGFVAECAPNHTQAGHVSTTPQDLMYAGPQPWRPSELDVGRDDYFDHDNVGCLDLADSAFLTPTQGRAVAPPGWPLRALSARNCAREGSLVSSGDVETSVSFVNTTQRTLELFWLNFQGQREPFATLEPISIFNPSTFAGHHWLVADQAGNCEAIFTADRNPKRAIVGK